MFETIEIPSKKPGRQRRRQRKHNANVDSGGGRNLRRSFFPERSRETRHGDGANRPDRIRTETTSSRDVSDTATAFGYGQMSGVMALCLLSP